MALFIDPMASLTATHPEPNLENAGVCQAGRFAVFVLMSIHHPKPGREAELIDSMHRYGDAIRGKRGLMGIHTLKDRGSSRLVGLAIFESEADFLDLAPIARAAVEFDPFEEWEEVEIDGLRLEEV